MILIVILLSQNYNINNIIKYYEIVNIYNDIP